MPEAKFLSITFNFEGRPVPSEKLIQKFDKALDWASYAPNCYLIYTKLSCKQWFDRIRQVIHNDDSVFVVKIDIHDRTGWLPENIWQWIEKDR